MYLETHNKLGNPQRVEATRVVVYDAEDNPIALAVEISPRVILAATADHSDFQEMLRGLGIDKVVVCTDLSQKPLDQVRIQSVQ